MLEEKHNSISEDIGEVILKTSSIHLLAAEIISRYYQGNDNNNRRVSFLEDILTNEYASFSLVTDCLKRVLINLGFDKDTIERDIAKKMRTIGNLRNQFAHEVPLFNKIHYLRKKKLPYHGEGDDFKEKIDTFNSLYKEVIEELKKIIEKRGTKVVGGIPDGYRPPTEEFN